MARVLVTAVRVREKRTPETLGFVATCYFSGNDVEPASEGLPYDMDIEVTIPYTLADLKTAITVGAQNLGAALGLTIATTDVDMTGFESAP